MLLQGECVSSLEGGGEKGDLREHDQTLPLSFPCEGEFSLTGTRVNVFGVGWR